MWVLRIALPLEVDGGLEAGVRQFVKQDVSSFFDSLPLQTIVPLLRHYRAPELFIGLLEAFYSNQRRCFKVACWLHHGKLPGSQHGTHSGVPLGATARCDGRAGVGHVHSWLRGAMTVCFGFPHRLMMHPVFFVISSTTLRCSPARLRSVLSPMPLIATAYASCF